MNYRYFLKFFWHTHSRHPETSLFSTVMFQRHPIFQLFISSKPSNQPPQQTTSSFQRCRPLSSVQIARLQPFHDGGGCFPAGAKTKGRSGDAQRIPADGEYTQKASQREKRKRKTCLDSSFSEPERSKLSRGRVGPTT